MKLPSYKRLYKQDFSQQYQALAEQLANTINNAFDSLYALSSNQISLRDNIRGQVTSFNITVDKNGNPANPVNVTMTSPGNIEGITVLNVTNQTASTGYPTGGVFCSFTQASGGIQILNVTGLIPGNNYLIKLAIYQF